ncbi:hypothetical protein CFI10_09365 [Marinobacterium iners]|nr:hypothetical protein CFI10_09365 [Marinobacterium iners]
MVLPPTPVQQPLCIIDYLSFTWCPSELAPMRTLASSGQFVDPDSEEAKPVKTMSQFIKYRESVGDPLDVHWLEFAALDELKTFFWTVGKDIFANCQYSTRDLWEEHFQLIERAGGVFGYRRSFDLVLDGHVIGMAASGGSQASCYVSITGRGCRLLDMSTVARVLRSLPFVNLTRVDVALDDYEGVTGGFHASREAFLDGKFITRGKPPECDISGSGGKPAKGKREIEYTKGCTFYVGSRGGGKLYRGYEKGLQLQSTEHPNWFRHEVELRSSNREISLHVLTDPDSYFAGFYPYMAAVLEMVKSSPVTAVPSPCKRNIVATKRTAKAAYLASVENLKRVGGGVINVMRQSAGLTDSEIINLLIRDAVPRSLSRVAVPGLVQ